MVYREEDSYQGCAFGQAAIADGLRRPYALLKDSILGGAALSTLR